MNSMALRYGDDIGHEDHIGAVPFLLSDLDIPVYGTAFTLALVERRRRGCTR